MKYQITITLPGAEPVVSEVETDDLIKDFSSPTLHRTRLPHEHRGVVENRVRRLQKRYPQADISWREVSNDLPRT